MNKALASILKTKLAALNYFERTAGLVQKIEMAAPADGSASSQILKFPISADITFLTARRENLLLDLIPNSSSRGVAYFEDKGSKVLEKGKYQSSLRLICWYDGKQFYQDPILYEPVVMANVIAAISGQRYNADPFAGLYVKAGAIVSDASIFSPYSYDEKTTQYLMPPYSFFAVDLELEYRINTSCLNT